MLVIDAELWPNGDRGDSEPLGRIGIARVATSTGGDYADYVVVHLRGCVAEAKLLRRCHVMSGWRAILSTALEPDAGSPVELDDPRVVEIAERLLTP